MKIYNPIIIPRNHIVEKAIDEAVMVTLIYLINF